MHRSLIVLTAAAAIAVASAPAQAGGNGVAVGLVSGLAVGTMIGVAAAQPRPYYYAPTPVYVEPVPACYWTRGAPVWDGYRGMWVRPRVRVCD